MYKIKDWFINFVNIKFNMYLCIFIATVITVYKYDKQKTIAYTDQNSPRWKKVKNETFYSHIAELNVVQKKILHGDISSSFFAYFISVYVSFIIANNCGFVMGFQILAIYFRL